MVAGTLSDQATYSRLGVFVSILIARHCFPLQSFVTNVPISSLLKAWEDVKDSQISRQAELGARLSCHLLLMLFQSVEGKYCFNNFSCKGDPKHCLAVALLGNSIA